MKFKPTDQRLREAKCSDHLTYDNMCINCRTRYFDNLIADSYVSISLLEEVEQNLRYQTARGNSLQVERDSLRAEVADLKNSAEVDKAFYNLTVAQRDAAWHELQQRLI